MEKLTERRSVPVTIDDIHRKNTIIRILKLMDRYEISLVDLAGTESLVFGTKLSVLEENHERGG